MSERILDELRENWAAVKRGQVFSQLESKPEAWSYQGGCRYVRDEVECALCETMINYRYPLVHSPAEGSASKGELLVGRECVVNFYEAYFPNGLDVVLDMMKNSFKIAQQEVVAKKLAAFRREYPRVCTFLLDTSDSKKSKYRSVTLKTPDPDRIMISFKRFGNLDAAQMTALTEPFGGVTKDGVNVSYGPYLKGDQANEKFREFAADQTVSNLIFTEATLLIKCSTAKFRAILKRRGYLRPNEIEALIPNIDRWINDNPGEASRLLA